MVYHSIPDPSKTYPDRMTNFELTKFELHNATFTPDGLISRVDATVTTFFPLEMTFTRAEVIGFMKKQGMNFYYKSKKLFLKVLDGNHYIHAIKCSIAKDILEAPI